MGTLSTNYFYNALGERIRKTNKNEDTFYLYDEAGQLMGEYTKTGKAKVEYIWLGNVPVGTVIFDSAGKANLYYVETDQLYTPRVMTDQNRKTVWEWKSDPFGTTLPTGTITYNQRFAGQFYDVESGLHYHYKLSGL